MSYFGICEYTLRYIPAARWLASGSVTCWGRVVLIPYGCPLYGARLPVASRSPAEQMTSPDSHFYSIRPRVLRPLRRQHGYLYAEWQHCVGAKVYGQTPPERTRIKPVKQAGRRRRRFRGGTFTDAVPCVHRLPSPQLAHTLSSSRRPGPSPPHVYLARTASYRHRAHY